MHPDTRGGLPVSLIRSLAAIVAAALLASACTLETTGAVKGEHTYFARFDDVQELVIGHTVRISDVNIGTVLGIELDGYEAVVEFTIENGRELPRGTSASIAMTSLLGENYVALRLPEDTDAPALEPGATLASGGTTASVEELAVELLALTRAVQGRDIAAIAEAGAVGIGPRGGELNELIGTVGTVTDGLASQVDVFDALLTDLDALLPTLAADAEAIGETIELAADATGSLARQRERLLTVVEDLTSLAVTLDAEVLAPHRARLTRLIDDLVPVVAVVEKERGRLIRTVEQLVTVTERLPTAIHESGVIAYALLDEFTLGDQQFQSTDLATALDELLLGFRP